jgi:hypothetical protein
MGLFDDLWNAAQDAAKAGGDLLTGHPGQALHDVEQAGQDVWDAITQTAQAAWDAGQGLIDVGAGAIAFVANGVVTVMDTARFWTEVGGILGAAGGFVLLGPEAVLPLAFVGATIGYVAGDAQAALRQLTPAEINFAKAVFGNTVPYDRVFLTDQAGFGGRPFTTPALNFSDKILVNLGPAFTSPMTSTSKAYPAPGQVLIHELTHAWQIGTSSFVPGLMCAGLWNQIQYGAGTDVYALGLDFGQDWNAYNLEQQGHLVDLWFKGGMDPGHRYYRYIADNIRQSAPGSGSSPRFFKNLQWCGQCQGLVRNIVPAGVCPNAPTPGGPHVPGTYTYILRQDDWELLGASTLAKVLPWLFGEPVTWDNLWFLCGKCKGVAFAGGVCPKDGGPHVGGSEIYALAMPPSNDAVTNFFINPDNTNLDPASCWTRCIKCNALFWNAGNSPSTCPAGGSHQSDGVTVYTLEMYQP